ncbi:hypothetical protein ACLB2K_067260 [Fragaria x ananassa]
MSSTDKCIRRTVGSGTWKGNDSEKPVKSFETGRVIGSKKKITYENEESDHHGCWILFEFYLDRSLRDKKEKAKDYVLCLLRKNGEPKTKIEKKRKQREEEEVLENNDACDDGEQSNTEKEELLEPQAKRQQNVSAPPVPMPSEDDAFVAELEESLECVQDDNSPPLEAEAIGFQVMEDGGLQQLACEVQSGPPFVPLPDEDFVMEEWSNNVCGGLIHLIDHNEEDDAFVAELEESLEYVQDDNSPTSEAEPISYQGAENGGLQQLACEVQSDPSFVPLPEDDFELDEEFFEEIYNYVETEEQDPAGSNILCEGLMDFEDGDGLDWINSISFSPEENSFF